MKDYSDSNIIQISGKFDKKFDEFKNTCKEEGIELDEYDDIKKNIKESIENLQY